MHTFTESDYQRFYDYAHLALDQFISDYIEGEKRWLAEGNDPRPVHVDTEELAGNFAKLQTGNPGLMCWILGIAVQRLGQPGLDHPA